MQRDVCALDGICRDRPSLRGTRCFVVRRRVGSLIVVVVVVVVVVRLQRWYILQQRERIGELNRCRIEERGRKPTPVRPREPPIPISKREQRGGGEGYEQELLDVVHEGKSARVNAKMASLFFSLSLLCTRRGARGDRMGMKI